MMKKRKLMSKFSLLLLILFLSKINATAQTVIDDQRFGFRLTVPVEWFVYGKTEFDERRGLSEYAFFGTLPDSIERTNGRIA